MSKQREVQMTVQKLLSRRIDDADWIVPQLSDEPPVNAFPVSAIVAAGDGGTWVPVYVYLKRKP